MYREVQSKRKTMKETDNYNIGTRHTRKGGRDKIHKHTLRSKGQKTYRTRQRNKKWT